MKNTTKNHFNHLWYFFISANLLPFLTIAIDTITPTQPLTKNQTLVSSGEIFELGFFTPGKSDKSYIGIWYKEIPEKTIVWVANRDDPIINSSGVLRIGKDGNLILVDEADNFIWSSSNKSRSGNTVARLLDSGNFVLYEEKDDDPDDYLWQSFDYPTDTLLPDMKFGWDKKTGLNRYLTSWKKADDPSSGDYTFKLDILGYPDAYLSNKQGIIYRSGPWNGVSFSGVPEMKRSPIFTFSVEMNKDQEVFYSYGLRNKSLYSRLLVNYSGTLQRYMWISTSQAWNLFWYATKDQCDKYAECGAYGICDANKSPVCTCMKGFEPKNPQAWFLRDGSGGCVRKKDLDCGDDVGFLTLSNLKLPYSSTAFVNQSMNLYECEKMCKMNCSCRGYSNSNITAGGSGCVVWTDDLVDMRQYAVPEGGQDLFVRVAASDLGSENHSVKNKHIIEIAGIVASIGIVLSGVIAASLWRRRRRRSTRRKLPSVSGIMSEYRGGHTERSQDFFMSIASRKDHSGECSAEEFELPLFDFITIALATQSFSDANKLGQGGFGVVYKGILAEGQEVAVKRLSKTSVQGVEELKNEVKLIARLQHRNLVRLLGCCIDIEEKLLIYEYMENNSLDSIIFNKEKSSVLDWQKRFNIILGIARGLVYLHQDSRFRIIHRDLKASNVLLDRDMDPKISDFGMARIFGGDQTEANTKRVVGTYGYMSPEYAMDGLFSVKSDVFSFGVLVLEIISGMKNRGFYKTNNQLNLLAYAWKLWREGRGKELLDPAVGDSYSELQVIRCIQVGLLCVQEQAEDRPTMGTVVLMLSSETISLTQPKVPGFCLGRRPRHDSDSSSIIIDESCTVNDVTVTVLDPR